MRIILSGGGTGGHIYPAVAVAEALKRRLGDDVELLFVGAAGKMEMEKIPALGYRIEGLPTAGLHRKLDARNLLLPLKIARSLRMARKVIRDFGADAVVGFGGYASGPVLRVAQRMGIPTVIQEQNSYAGLTNKLLGKRAQKICVAYEGMERFFPPERRSSAGSSSSARPYRVANSSSDLPSASDRLSTAGRIELTGNPLRGDFSVQPSREEALAYFGFTPDKPVLLVVGGSLGSRTLNDMMKRHVERLASDAEIQVIWQTGKFYETEIDGFMAEKFGDGKPVQNIWRNKFIDRMDYAYAAADLVISRSGATTVSELSLLGKATLFVPSPNVSEDHQTKNAMALVERGAAEICPDSMAVERAIPLALRLLGDRARLDELSAGIRRLAIADSADRVAEIVTRLITG
ncbi:MAG: UDP-N-acetylglucosamine--N-acetylmuramyl-(pentapeptide) pyrophosphoryl-undecaprenol N-acetylglucosamine transferase [Alistipes sp.]|jgi:UDP-N-acetylglucosamine--N-acetylmuramyl-(pentapeptide) pyrophosphoryl-undecaprenol N-acetylglucosamine transferase|nr:UDP-N-acetylglucosamine--N-acetylmuramyl-(pentapeptide) pyrophosphoryl-undecaprenol N-acetylglucosamine transferase [Alistipes sp.]